MALIPTITGLAPALMAINDMGGLPGIMANPANAGNALVLEYTGYNLANGQMDYNILIRNIGMWLAGYVTHKVLNFVGVNKSIQRVPVIGKYLTL
jgi:hypothetical protein